MKQRITALAYDLLTLALLAVARACRPEDAWVEAARSSSATGISDPRFPVLISILSFLTSAFSLWFSIWFNIWPPDGLVEYSRFRSSPEIGDNTLTVTYIFSSTGKLAHLIDEVGVYEVYKHIKSPAVEGEGGVCLDWRLNPGNSLQMPQQMRDALVNFPNEMMAKYTTPVRVALSDGGHDKFDTMIVPAQEQRAVTATFRTTPANLERYNAIVMCPTFRYLGADGQPRTAICKGWEVDVIAGGGRISHGDPPPVKLLPSLNTTLCRLTF